ncbi:hypothetical protein GDO86_013736 [Hymenochirus boettgeri]|uniref:Uncharacterized protein n=1 Tax=Hymenochirus boettgeri TaxID=247094 RepID=A0A8T2JQX5_9PIPI|nr:hypothetical protein GDO86_013736 [Hymenochirus boettgeri]
MTTILNPFNLQENREQNKDLLHGIENLTPTSNRIEEENARLRAESKTMQSRIQMLESELNLAKAETRMREKELVLANTLFCNLETEYKLQEMKEKMRESILQKLLKKMHALQEKLAEGEEPYREEIYNLKTKMLKIEMEKDKQIGSLKSCLDDKEERIRKLKEEHARSDTDNTVLQRKKTMMDKKFAVSPSRSVMSGWHFLSPGKTKLHRKPIKTPCNTDAPLLGPLTSPRQRRNVHQNLDSPQSAYFGSKSKVLPYCPSHFFDNSKLGSIAALNVPEQVKKETGVTEPTDSAPECNPS